MKTNPGTNDSAESPWEKLGITTLPMPNVGAALDILWNMETRITLCLIGDTGIGKTPVVHDWVRRQNGFLYTLNFGHMSPEQVSMSMFNEEATEFGFVQSSWFAEVNRQAEEKGCAVLFLDEWNRGDKQLVNALFTLTDERRIHDHHLHPNVMVVAAMNPSDGTYLVNEAERDHAIRKRLCFAYVTPDLASWLSHAEKNGYDPLVTDFVRAQTTLFYDAAARDAGKAFPCPSNWEKVSNIVKSARKSNLLAAPVLLSLLSGQIGYTAAHMFTEYMRDKNTVISPDEILYSYKTTGRARIAKLLGSRIVKGTLEKVAGEGVRADVLATLNEGLALTLLSSRPAVDSIADNVRDYMLDLPDEFFMSLLTVHFLRFSKEIEGASDYINKLNNALLGTDGAFRERMRQVITNASAIEGGKAA